MTPSLPVHAVSRIEFSAAPCEDPAMSTGRDAPGQPWKLYTADIAGVAADLLDDPARVESALRRAVDGFGEDAVFRVHRFPLRGLSLVAVGARVRLALHTWPERDAATLDLYLACSDAEPLVHRCVEELLRDPT